LQDTIAKPDVEKPSLTEEEFFQAFPDATYGQYGRYVARYEYAVLRAEDQREGQQRERETATEQTVRTYSERLTAAYQTSPNLKERLAASPVGQLIPIAVLPPGTPPTAWNHLAQDLIESELAGVLVAHLVDHPEELQRFGSLTEAQVHREFGKLEARLSPATAGSPDPLSTITKAPAPPTTLGSRTTDPGDPVTRAVREKDAGRYIEEMNKRELAARR
jgi:hypothetical protein